MYGNLLFYSHCSFSSNFKHFFLLHVFSLWFLFFFIILSVYTHIRIWVLRPFSIAHNYKHLGMATQDWVLILGKNESPRQQSLISCSSLPRHEMLWDFNIHTGISIGIFIIQTIMLRFLGLVSSVIYRRHNLLANILLLQLL